MSLAGVLAHENGTHLRERQERVEIKRAATCWGVGGKGQRQRRHSRYAAVSFAGVPAYSRRRIGRRALDALMLL